MVDEITNRITISGTLGGVAINSSFTLTATGALPAQQFALPAAVAGTLSTRTSDSAGELTLAADHGIVQGDVIDIYHVGGVSYGAVVGVVDGNDVPFTGAAGAVLPAEDAAVTTEVATSVDADWDGDLVEAIACLATEDACVVFLDDESVVIKAIELIAGRVWLWFNDGVAANALESNVVASMRVSQGGTTAGTFRMGGLYNSTE